VARSVIEAFEVNQEMLLLPKTAYFLQYVRNVTPTRFSDMLIDGVSQYAYRENEFNHSKRQSYPRILLQADKQTYALAK
jgi:hypothetical protein